MTLADVLKQHRPEDYDWPEYLLLEDVSWEQYERTLEEIERAGRRIRVTYDNGRMELMSPVSPRHEYVKTVIGRLIEIYAMERDLPLTGLGGLTCNIKVK